MGFRELPMVVEVKLFAAAKVAVGESSVRVEVADNATAADLRSKLAEDYSVLGSLLPSCRLAVAMEYVDESCVIRSGDECALIPPVSGG